MADGPDPAVQRLYAVSPDLWYQIAAASFTPELSTDWEDNNVYWRALESPVEEAAAPDL